MNPIDGDKLFAFLKEQKVKETGAFSKGLNKGLRIAMSVVNNKEITLPWEVERVHYGHWVPRHSGLTENWVDCSECGTVGSPHWKRCPVCEAKMDLQDVTDINVGNKPVTNRNGLGDGSFQN